MTDTNASARYAAQRATILNILGDQDVDGLRAMRDSRRSIRDLLLRQIGEAFVDSEEQDASRLRQQLWEFETICDLADRLVEEHERVEATAPD